MSGDDRHHEHRTMCPECGGNGEIIADWDRYLHPPEPPAHPWADKPDDGTAECPDCDGVGWLAPTPEAKEDEK